MSQVAGLPSNLWMTIQWMDDKRTASGWRDIRQNTKVHSFYWIRAGRGTFVTDEPLRVKSGMLFYLKPGLAMSMESDGEEPLRISMVLLKLSTVEKEIAVPVQELDLPFVTQVAGESQQRLDERFEALTSGWVPGQPAEELRAKAVLYELLYEIVQLQYSSPAAEIGPELFRRIKGELERDFAQPLRLKEVAARSGISVSHLRELFHRYLGMSPKSYLDQVRNEHAKKRLIYTSLTVREIGESCGYADEYHFSKRFKQANGLPPLAFRMRNR